KKVIHYAEHDTEFLEDFYSIDLIKDGKIIGHWGDWYHDKGRIKCDAFVEGIKFCLEDLIVYDTEIEIEEEKVADGKV
ncbi:MAG: hypothetical protein ACOC1O_06485, partial [bacterium]